MLTQQHQAGGLGPALIKHAQLGPDHGFYAGAQHGAVKLDGRKGVAVFGHGHGGHIQLDGLVGQPLDPDQAVDQGIFRVQMQMYKTHALVWGKGSLDLFSAALRKL